MLNHLPGSVLLVMVSVTRCFTSQSIHHCSPEHCHTIWPLLVVDTVCPSILDVFQFFWLWLVPQCHMRDCKNSKIPNGKLCSPRSFLQKQIITCMVNNRPFMLVYDWFYGTVYKYLQTICMIPYFNYCIWFCLITFWYATLDYLWSRVRFLSGRVQPKLIKDFLYCLIALKIKCFTDSTLANQFPVN